VDVDSIEQWPADPFLIAADGLARAFVFAHRVAEVPAWTRIYRRDEDKGNRKRNQLPLALLE
jgi:hypothetical protein